MRLLLNLGIVAAFASALSCANPSSLWAQRLEDVNELNKRATELFNARQYSDAIPIVLRVLAIREKTLSRDHPDVATSLNNLAALYQRLGRYADAEPLYQRSLAIFEKALGHDHPDVEPLLNNLAEVYESQGRYADAEPFYQRSLAIREKVLGRDDPSVGIALNDLAELFRKQGRYADAEPLYQRALAIYERALGSDHPAAATSLNNLALVYQSQGRYAEAEPLFHRSLAIVEKAFGPNHPDVATSLNNLAELYRNQGRYGDAELLYKRSLAIREKALGRGHPNVAQSLNNLATLYRNQGQYDDAEPLYKESLAIYETALGPDHPAVAMSLNNLAVLYQSQGRYSDAERLHLRSLAVYENALGPAHPEIASSLNNLAALYKHQGRYVEAEQFYRRALTIREQALGRDHPDVAESLNNIAELYQDQGRYGETETLYQRSLAIFEDALGRDHSHVATLLNNLAWLYGIQARYADAEPLYQRALTIAEKALGRDHPDVAEKLNNLAYLYMQQARYADALPIIKRTLSQGTLNKVIAFPVFFASQAQGLINAPQALADSYEVAQRASSSAAANAVSKLAARFAAGSSELAQLVRRDQDLAAEAESLDKAVLAFVSKPPAQRSAAAEEEIRKRIEGVKVERERISQIFNERFPDYVALSKPKPLSLQETQALLADDEALLVFDFGTKSYAWIVTSTDADWTELKISASELDAQVKTLRRWLTDPRQRFDPGLAYKIYQATFGAFADKIAARKRLTIITNGALTSLPPALLVTKDPSGKTLKDLDWLIRSHAITVLPSVASLKVLRGGSQTSSARKPMIAFADPVFSKAARASAQQQAALESITSFYRGTQVDVAAIGEHLPQLPGTRREVKEIAAELEAPSQDVRLGVDATETAVKQAKLDQYRIVYFATHGLVSGYLEQFAKSKAEPALALSIPAQPTEEDDGLLTASEIAQLKLDADWAVLSACNTAAEEKPGAEALSGLARAFFYAGARSLIVSHWSVSDEATARLMVGTFRASARDPKLSHAEALRQSMLAMIDGAKSDAEADPRLWASFVVVGEPTKPE
jgi:CHAT domain-containing protein/Tfp pilus assembly protein PilF